MRYSTPVYFQRITQGEYDASTGNYGAAVIDETCVYAAVMDTQAETMTLVYGELRQGSLTIQLQTPHLDPFDRIRVGDKVYRVDFMRRLPVKQTFIVSEVQ